MTGNYFKSTRRWLTKHPVYSIINIGGLSLGLCACMVIDLVVRYEFSYDAFHPDKDRIYRVVGDLQRKKEFPWKMPTNSIPTPAPPAIRREFPGVTAVAGFRFYEATVSIPNAGSGVAGNNGDKKFNSDEQTILADPSYFDIFPYQWLAGNPSLALNEPFKVVLSESKARRYFGPVPFGQLIGREVVYDDSLRVYVSGVVRDWDKVTDFPFTGFISSATIGRSFLKTRIQPDEWGEHGSLSFCLIKLSKGVSAAHINAELADLINRNMGLDSIYRINLHLQPLSDIHFNEAFIHRDYESRKAHLPALYTLMGIASFILLVAIINFINLSTAQSIGRAKEIGIRKILGSGRTTLIAQHLLETGILTFLAWSISMVLLKPVLSTFRSYLPPGIKTDIFEPSFLIFSLALLVVTTLLAGLYPARIASANLPVLNLKAPAQDWSTAGKTGLWNFWKRPLNLRKPLIVFQFVISLILIIGALVINKQIRFMHNTDLGFNHKGVFSITPPSFSSISGPSASAGLPSDNYNKLKLLAGKVRQLPGVTGATLQSLPPLEESSGYLLNIHYKGQRPLDLPIGMIPGSDDYIPLYLIKLLAGRNLVKSDSLNELVINETLSKALGFSDPRDAVGQLLYAHDKALPVVGVMADFHNTALYKPIGPMCIVHIPEEERSIGVKLSGENVQSSAIDITQILSRVEKIEKEVYTGTPKESFVYSFLDDSLAHLYDKEEKTAWLINTATGIAIFISCIGLFGMAMFTVGRREKEIGIRKVLGAGVANIAALLTTDFARLILVALLIASPIAWYFMTRWLENFSYRIAINGWIFLPAGVLALSAALLTTGFHVLKAATANPINSLRAE